MTLMTAPGFPAGSLDDSFQIFWTSSLYPPKNNGVHHNIHFRHPPEQPAASMLSPKGIGSGNPTTAQTTTGDRTTGCKQQEHGKDEPDRGEPVFFGLTAESGVVSVASGFKGMVNQTGQSVLDISAICCPGIIFQGQLDNLIYSWETRSWPGSVWKRLVAVIGHGIDLKDIAPPPCSTISQPGQPRQPRA